MTPDCQASLFPESQELVTSRIDAQISWLLFGHAGGALNIPLEHREREVLRLLRYRRGLANAMPLREIEEKAGLSPREIKETVRALRLNFHLPIGSSKSGTAGGYYLIVSAEDMAAWVKDFTDQIRAQAEVLRAVAGAPATQALFGQLALEVKQ